MKNKKICSIILTVVMAMGLMAGCGSSDSGQTANADNKTESTIESEDTTEAGTGDAVSEAETEEASETEETTASSETGKTLVVYYSSTGNTQGVAETIADITGGDLFEIEPKDPYTSDDLDWTDNDSRVSREHDDENLRDVELVTTTIDNWDSYDTVYIGYPIWWGIAAWPVDNFVKENDFTGKTVIPFCTSASSGIGESGSLLEEMAGTGDWKDGESFHGGASETDIRSWIDSLGL